MGALHRSVRRRSRLRRPADDDGPAREVLGVVGDLGHELVGERGPHAAVAVGAGDRAAAIDEVTPDPVGLAVVLRVGVVEIGRPVADRPVGAGYLAVAAHDDSSATIEMANSGQLATARRAASA